MDKMCVWNVAAARRYVQYGIRLLQAMVYVLVILSRTIAMGGESSAAELRIVAFGDNEGVTARPGTDPARKNPVLPRLMQILQEEDEKRPIDLLLHTGDFVRFDPSPQLFLQALGPFVSRFYPTTGGDSEFLHGKYWEFVRAVPHLRQAVLQRIAMDHNGYEAYYAVQHKGVHIISLYNPDQYGESERSPEFTGYNLFHADHPNRRQYRWLVERLEEIRGGPGKQELIIVLSHRPVYNQSRHLVELFDRYRVDLVLSGDIHAYGRAQSRHTLYIVTGIMGDQAVGGCDRLNALLGDEFLKEYQRCLPVLGLLRRNEFSYYYDHYLDLRVEGRKLELKAVEIDTGQVLDTVLHRGED